MTTHLTDTAGRRAGVEGGGHGVLVAHGDAFVVARIAAGLRRRGERVVCATTAAETLSLCGRRERIELALLHAGLRDLASEVLQARLRGRGVRGILMLAGAGDLAAGRLARRAGADDYICGPFQIDELLARCDAVRRRRVDLDPTTTIGDVWIDAESQVVTVAGRRVTLTRKEFELLVALARAAGAPVTRQRLLVEVWGTDWDGAPQTITVHASTLRRKLGRPGAIEAVRGVGYRLATRER